MYQIRTPWQRIKAHFEFWVIDHEFVRAIYRNFHQIDEHAYRSAHPSPKFIKKLQKEKGLKTIINLRGENLTGQYMLELEACEKLGVTLISIPFSSRNSPTPESIKNLFNALDTIEYPVLLHCKSGADRAGIGSALYQYYKNNIALDESKQLRPSYGHFKTSETGVLDYFINEWNRYLRHNPHVEFLTWIENNYDDQQINKEFVASRFANLLVNKILRRE